MRFLVYDLDLNFSVYDNGNKNRYFYEFYFNVLEHNAYLRKSATGAGKPGSPNLFGQKFILNLDFNI
jgi:hypothetical protein